MRVGLAPSLKRAGEFKKRLHLPVFHACRITDMATARHATEIFAADLFRGRTALVTGGGTGIGLAIARERGRLGASVVIAALRREVLDGAASEMREAGIDATALTLNIRDERAVEALFEELGARG